MEEMENIFENSYFGKPYKTKDGRKAIYGFRNNGRHVLFVEYFTCTFEYNDNGVSNYPNDKLDIIGKWEEPINKEELDRIDIINMLRGTTPCYSIMMDIPNELGRYCGGFVDEWKWNISTYNIEYFKNYSDEYLLELYYKCKNGE